MQRDCSGPIIPTRCPSMNDLGLTYATPAGGTEAVSLLEDVLQRRRAALGPDHGDTLRSMHNLANVYRDSGRLADAIPIYEEMLARLEKKLGSENVDTINAMNNLATAYQHAGRLAEALALFEGAPRLHGHARPRARQHGDRREQPRECLPGAGRLADALPMLEDTLETMKARLGPDHPHTLMSMYNLARAYLDVKSGSGRAAVARIRRDPPEEEPRRLANVRDPQHARRKPAPPEEMRGGRADPARGLRGNEGSRAENPWAVQEAISRRGRTDRGAYEASGKTDLADQWRHRLEVPAAKAAPAP